MNNLIYIITNVANAKAYIGQTWANLIIAKKKMVDVQTQRHHHA